MKMKVESNMYKIEDLAKPNSAYSYVSLPKRLQNLKPALSQSAELVHCGTGPPLNLKLNITTTQTKMHSSHACQDEPCTYRSRDMQHKHIECPEW